MARNVIERAAVKIDSETKTETRHHCISGGKVEKQQQETGQAV